MDDTTQDGVVHNPYRTFRFQIHIDGQPVAGLSKMSALKKTTNAIAWRTGGDPTHEHKLPGGTSYEPITLEQGLTQDTTFENWANTVNQRSTGNLVLAGFRRNLTITVLNLEGKEAIGYKVFRAWVSEYQALPDLDANSMDAVGIQTITIEHEGWERDIETVDDQRRKP